MTEGRMGEGLGSGRVGQQFVPSSESSLSNTGCHCS